MLPWWKRLQSQFQIVKRKQVEFAQKTIEFGDSYVKVPALLSDLLKSCLERTLVISSSLANYANNKSVDETLNVVKDVNLYISSQAFRTFDGYNLNSNPYTNALNQVKSEIRSMKGSLLSSRNFPTPSYQSNK